MAYLGTPIDTQNQFQSLQGKRFSGDGSTTAFTLDIAPSSVFDIEVFVENVRQDPNSAYGISGTTLTFTGAPPSGTNNIYVVHQAKAVGTIDVSASSVVPASLASNILTGQTDIGAAIADADLLLVDDGAGGTLRKTAASRLKTYIGDNTPVVLAYQSSDQDLSKGSDNKIVNWTTTVDTDSAFSSNKFTVPSGEAGNYFINFQLTFDGDSSGNTGYDLNAPIIYKNGSEIIRHNNVREPQIPYGSFAITCVLALAASDYIEFYFHPDRGGGSAGDTTGESNKTWFQIFKLIG